MPFKLVPIDSDEASCPVQLEPYHNPVVLVDCGHSFSERTVQTLRASKGVRCCPTCRIPITHQPLPNYALRAIMETKGSPSTTVYELFCIDVSTSMWYSDYVGPLALIAGQSRIKMATEFCSKIATARQADPSHRMGLIAFGTNISLKCDFAAPLAFQESLKTLEPIEDRTRIFDAFDTAIEHLASKENCECRLYLLTDGGENFSSEENKQKMGSRLDPIIGTAQRLKISTIVFNVGGNVDDTRKIADAFHATFKDINSKNVKQMANDMCMVEFPNRTTAFRNILQGTQFPARESPTQVRQSPSSERAPPSPQNAEESPNREKEVLDAIAQAPAAPSHQSLPPDQVVVVPTQAARLSV